jgi:hypothetical protein
MTAVATRRAAFTIGSGRIVGHPETIHFDGLSPFRQLRRLGARIGVGRFGQLDLYPPSGWSVVQDFAASASSIPSQRTELRRLFRETIPDCSLQCGPTKRSLLTCLAKRPSLCVSSIRPYSCAGKSAPE